LELGKEFPWERPERCPRCGNCRIWGHGFVEAYFDKIRKTIWLRRYRCPRCRTVIKLKPSGYFRRFQSSIETIRESIAHRLYHHLWPPGSSRQRQGHWLRSYLLKIKFYLGLNGLSGEIMEAFETLVSQGVNPVSRSFLCDKASVF